MTVNMKIVWRGESRDGTYEAIIEPMPHGEYAVWRRHAIFQSLPDAESSVGKRRGSGPLPGGAKGWHPLRESRPERKTSMSYGEIPPFEQFEHDVHTRIDPDYDRPYWPEGTLYTMELVTSHEIELAETFGLEEFEAERQITGRNTKVRGFKDNERAIYEFIEFLIDRWNNGDEEAGELASSIMYTLGYEWI